MRSAMATVRSSICPVTRAMSWSIAFQAWWAAAPVGRESARSMAAPVASSAAARAISSAWPMLAGLNTRLPSADWVRHRANPASLKPAASSATGAAAAGSDRTTPSLTARTPGTAVGPEVEVELPGAVDDVVAGSPPHAATSRAVPSTTKSQRFSRIIAMAHSCRSADPAPIPGPSSPDERT